MPRIVDVEILQVDLPPKVPRSDAIQSFVTQETPIVRIVADDGSRGTGYSYTIGTGGSSVVALLADHLAPRLLGRDVDDIEAIWKDLFFHTHATAVGAITALALAAIDTALWDLRGRRLGVPLWKLAGGAQARVPVYSTEGGWLQLDTDTLVRESVLAKEAGFRGVKIKVGKPHVCEDVARLRAVREAVGEGFEIMTDANQGFDVAEAIRRARHFEPLDLAWFEEPLPAEDLGGHVRLAASTSIPIAVGESMYSLQHFREYLQRDACSIVQVDVARIARHHAVAQGGAPGRELQRAGVPALPDGAARLADRGGPVGEVGRVHPAARRRDHLVDRDRGRLRDRAADAGQRHRLGLDGDRRARGGAAQGARLAHRCPPAHVGRLQRPQAPSPAAESIRARSGVGGWLPSQETIPPPSSPVLAARASSSAPIGALGRPTRAISATAKQSDSASWVRW